MVGHYYNMKMKGEELIIDGLFYSGHHYVVNKRPS
jgi:hypothetical protein